MRIEIAVLLSSLAALLCLAPGCGADGLTSQMVEMSSERESYGARFQPDPDPPRVGRTTYLVELRDGSDSPVDGASLAVEPWMPAHGHGTKKPPEIEELGDGTYRVDVFYQMGGFWELTVDVDDGATQDRFVLGQDVYE